MKKYIRLWLAFALAVCVMSGCGSLAEMKTDNSWMETSSIYGNSYTNIRNDGAAHIDENGRVVYFCKADTKGIVGNLSETQANELTNMELYYINVVGDTMYAYLRWVGSGFIGDGYGYFGSGLVSYDLTTPQEEIDWYSFQMLRKGVILDLQVVDGIGYFIDAVTMSFCSYDLATGEEVVLINKPVREAMVYQNHVFYIEEEKKGIYSLSLETGEEKKISSFGSKQMMPYKDKILFFSNFEGLKVLAAVSMEGGDETFLKIWDASEVTLYGDKLYFIDKKDRADIGFIDLTDEELEIQYLGLTDEIQSTMYAFAGEQITEKVSGYYSEERRSMLSAQCAHLSAMNGYLLFDSGYAIVDEPYRAMYAYHIETGELILLNQQFNIPMEWENILW